MNASEPRKVTQQESPTDTAPEPVGPSMARVEALGRHLDQWESKGHETVGIDWLRRHFALAADSSAPAPDGHAALVARLMALADDFDEDARGIRIATGDTADGTEYEGAARQVRAAITATDRAASDESRVALEAEVARLTRSKVALVEQVKRLQDQIARANMHPGQDRQKAMYAYVADRDALRVTVAERDATIGRLVGVLDDYCTAGCCQFAEDNERRLHDRFRAALDGPDDRSGGQS